MGQNLRRFSPCLQQLEARDLPSTVLVSESFDSRESATFPNDWNVVSTRENGRFISTGLAAATGKGSLASTGSIFTSAMAWYGKPVDSNAAVSLKVRSDGPAPIDVIARGSSDYADYIAVRVHPSSGTIELIDVKQGKTDVLSTLKVQQLAFGPWYNVTLLPDGETATVVLTRGDTGQYLNADGVWQAEPTTAMSATIAASDKPSFVGLGRGKGGYGLAFLDDFEVTVQTHEFRENFDSSTTLPIDWQTWSNHGSQAFTITDQRFVSPNHGVAVDGGSPVTARAWHADTSLADVQASASIYVDSLIPASLIVRGQNLDTPKPSYYGLTITRGLNASLTRVVDGQSTTLTSIKSNAYFSQKWLRATLTVRGDQLQAVLFRQDTQQWLGADGNWHDFPEPVLNITDNTLSLPGTVGLNRDAHTAGRVTFDDVEVIPAAEIAGPTIDLSSSQSGKTFSSGDKVTGEVTFTVTESGTPMARRVVFELDGEQRAAFANTPASWTFKSQRVANGLHTLVVRAIDGTGNATVKTLEFETSNADASPPPTRPELPRHYDHIRIAQLAYAATPFGQFESDRLADSVDLVIPNTKFLERINDVAPNTPQLIYTNVSNLYQGLLLNWLNYADGNSVNRELAFYHVTKPTEFVGGSPSSQPVTWLWNVSRTDGPETTDLTSAAHGGRSFGVALGGSDSQLSLGYPDRFAELNFNLSKPAGSNWFGVFEYPTKVSNNGEPVEWAALSLLNDGTKGFQQSGRVEFNPPSNWVASTVPDTGERLFALRLRTVMGSEANAPIATTILGRDYVQADGLEQGTIPAFDTAADLDHDGYLNPTEYANRSDGHDARFEYESRLFYPFYGQMRFVTNPTASAVTEWAGAYHKELLQSNPLADGLFLDNSNGRLPFQGVSVIEPTARYGEDSATLVDEVWRAIEPKIVVSNTAGGRSDAVPVAKASTGVLEEFLLRPTTATWSSVLDTKALVDSRLSADNPSPYVILDSHPGALAVDDPRVQIGTLAYYYLIGDPNSTFLMFHGGFAPSANWNRTWIPAISYDVGQPLGEMTEFATGADPQQANLTYKVFARDYSNALSLYKPRSYALGNGTGTLDNVTATTHVLDQAYRVLKPDGTLGATVTQVSLRNGEGVVLIKV